MDDFFRVLTIEEVLKLFPGFPLVDTEIIPIDKSLHRVSAMDIAAPENLPEFSRATMDGFAVQAASTFGASESNPALLTVKGSIAMGEKPEFAIGIGEAARIATGGMLPPGADGVVMIEYTDPVDGESIEVYRSIPPGGNVIQIGEDFRKNEPLIPAGKRLRPQEIGLLAAFGIQTIPVYRLPRIGIISTGDEIVPIDEKPGIGKIRDINTYTLSGMVSSIHAIPVHYGLVPDNPKNLDRVCRQALEETDMVLVSGGSSVGTRDFTIQVLSSLPQTEILVHGIAISPGKPTILACSGAKLFWGLPGHVVSAMVVFLKLVQPSIETIAGVAGNLSRRFCVPAVLTRNVPSVHGRTDYVRVRLLLKNGTRYAEPILGKSGLIQTMVKSDGLVEIDRDTEGLDKGVTVQVELVE